MRLPLWPQAGNSLAADRCRKVMRMHTRLDREIEKSLWLDWAGAGTGLTGRGDSAHWNHLGGETLHSGTTWEERLQWRYSHSLGHRHTSTGPLYVSVLLPSGSTLWWYYLVLKTWTYWNTCLCPLLICLKISITSTTLSLAYLCIICIMLNQN